jgi:D-xylose transport system substrate-binding protein
VRSGAVAHAQAIVEGRQFGNLWPAPDEMAVAGANAAVAMAQCKDIGATTTTDNGAGQIPWVKTPIYLITQDEMADFVCKHGHWLKLDEVYKNVPDKKPSCG